jgi:hypothetical protein
MKRFQEPMRPIAHFATAAALALIALEAFAQYPAQYPVRPMVIVGFAAGGDSDISARNLAQHRSSADTTKFVREQAELYERLATSLGIRE